MTNQARIFAINLELNRLRNDSQTASSSLSRTRIKLETLTSAEYKLSELLSNHSNFPTEYSNLGSSTWESQFRGSLKRGFHDSLYDIKDHLQTLKSAHQDRYETISNAIKTIENEERSLVASISVMNNKMIRLEQERRTLL